MIASRGDTKPCTVPNCAGTMQYGRRFNRYGRVQPLRPQARAGESTSDVDNVNGWSCSASQAHFRER